MNKKEFPILQKGISIYLSLMIMAVLLAIGLGISAIIVTQMKMLRGMGHSVIAFFAADTGIERVLYAISINDLHSDYSGSVGKACYEATLVCGSDYEDCPSSLNRDPDCLAPYYCLKSVGNYKETQRAIEIIQ